MYKNYFKPAWRNLKANKFYSILNISGLAVGLATGIMLLLWVQNEFSYDKFNKQYKHIYQVNSHITLNGKPLPWRGAPAPLSTMAKNIPGVISVLRIVSDNENPTLSDKVLSNITSTKIFDNNNIVYADSNFLNFFDYKLLHGTRNAFLPNAHSVAITQSTAKKLFDTDDAIGKVVRFDKNNFTVTAVLQDFPNNSSLHYDAIFPIDYYAQQFTANGGNRAYKTIDEDVIDYSFRTFLLINPNGNASNIEKKLTWLFNAGKGETPTTFRLQNLGDLHLTGIDGNNSALQMVKIMALVAILILIIASINYVNLSTARSIIRLKEVSIKKIIGAKRAQLFLQFVSETLLTFVLAFAIATALIILLKPIYDKITGEQLSFSLFNFSSLKMVLIALFGTLLISSIYPALLLSSFKPLGVIRDKSFLGIKTSSFRKTLVVLQFAISFILLVGTIVMAKQMAYIRNKDLGYDKSYVFTVSFPGDVVKYSEAIETELSKQSSVSNVAFSDSKDIANITKVNGDITWQGKPDNTMLMAWHICVDKNFIPTMKLHFIEGGNFTGMPSDDHKYILNETAVKAMGLKPPYVGTKIGYLKVDGEIAGVIKDFNFKSLKDPIAPLVIRSNGFKNILYVRTTGAQAEQAIAAVEKEYKKYADKMPFSYDFLDKSFESHYLAQQRTGSLFTTFAAIAIFISCLGLFGLATYTAQVKTKEIGIRKVLGASVSSIVTMLSKDFAQLVLIASVIAFPVAWWAMNKWLQSFAYRIHISWWIFVIAGLIAFTIALITVSFQAIKAAIANPVKSLRNE
ncbi:MAG: ABC transporter permease [Bacteroidota bacterium]|nr:ABC transporter permease [Bacteroidota bacterium]